MTNKKISDHVREAAERAALRDQALEVAKVAAVIYAANQSPTMEWATEDAIKLIRHAEDLLSRDVS